MKLIDLTGKRFGKLVVIRRGENRGPAARWVCQCDCGNTAIVWGSALRNGLTNSCKCQMNVKCFKHGKARSKTWRAWNDMKQRCLNPRNSQYIRYGGRGVTICVRWHNFINFLNDLGESPPKAYLDRIDNNGNYEPSNCRWATPRESGNNRSTNRFITYKGKTKTIAEWTHYFNFKIDHIRSRLRMGWSVRDTIEIPVGAKRIGDVRIVL